MKDKLPSAEKTPDKESYETVIFSPSLNVKFKNELSSSLETERKRLAADQRENAAREKSKRIQEEHEEAKKAYKAEMDRLVEALNRVKDEKSEDIVRNVKLDIEKFEEDAEQYDDITMMCLEYFGK